MANIIFTNKNYCIYQGYPDPDSKYTFIVHNKDKPFKDAHTHVESFGLAKILIYCCIKGELPSKSKKLYKNIRFMKSVLRVINNKYKNKFEKMLWELENTKKGTLPLR